LRGGALQWWKNYKLNRRKKGKEKVRTWKKLRSKLMGSFPPPTYMFNHVPLLPKKNGSKSSCMDIHFKRESPKGSYTCSLPTMLSLEELVSYDCEEEKEEGSNPFDQPPVFDDYGNEEISSIEAMVMKSS